MSQDAWPEAAERKYERLDVLGKGSFGMVWMARRITPAEDDFDDEYVAVKNILIKDEKSNVYAQREISILQELRHPHVIRLIRAHPSHGNVRLVVMQLARGPNLHQLVVKRGALGLPLCRMVSRQLIAAVSYLHGRAVIHRDIKPSNCILACTHVSPREEFDWFYDEDIWSNGKNAHEACDNGKWKLMLVDFGFARALEKEDIANQQRHLRNSIVYESTLKTHRTHINDAKHDLSDVEEDPEELDQLAESAARGMRSVFEATNDTENAIMGGGVRPRLSGVSMPLPVALKTPVPVTRDTRKSTSHHSVRSMSALGTKAYAAPEIRKQLRHKNEDDFNKTNAAMTECVADYGMIVDAYSVGWTLRVAMTGVPPNFTISEYMAERDAILMGGEDDDIDAGGCCCFQSKPVPALRIRDPSIVPQEATILITKMIEKKPENRMTVREAQNHPWIKGGPGESPWVPPHGDVPSNHGDPVVPLKCASELSKLATEYHMS
jgi:serine/threonine protein kinase